MKALENEIYDPGFHYTRSIVYCTKMMNQVRKKTKIEKSLRHKARGKSLK